MVAATTKQPAGRQKTKESKAKPAKKNRKATSPCAAKAMAVCLLGRPRSFDIDEALEAATAAFRKLGYVGCSLADLERATGVSRMSLYNAIGDKEAIFLAVLQRFAAGMEQHFRSQMPGKHLDEVIAMFTNFVSGKVTPAEACGEEGCLIVTASLERDQMSEPIRSFLQSCREGQVALFEEILEAEKQRGTLTPDINPKDGAEFIVNAYWGGAATARLYDDITPLKGPISVLIQVLKGWRLADS